MVWKHPIVARALLVTGVVGLAAVSWACPALAQHTADPYNPYNQQYEQFVYPQYPVFPGTVPNQNVIEGRSAGLGANQMQSFLNGADTFEPSAAVVPRRIRPGTPYYSAYRRLDRDYGRSYTPGESGDSAYYQAQQDRQEKYLAYLRERDPKRRAQLYREYTQSTLRASRDFNGGRATLSRSATATRTKADMPPAAPAAGRAPGLGTPATRRPAAGAARNGAAARSATTTPRANLSPSELLRRAREGESLKARETITPGSQPSRPTPPPG